MNQIQLDMLWLKWRRGQDPQPPVPTFPHGGSRSPIVPSITGSPSHLSQHEPSTTPGTRSRLVELSR